MKILRAIAVSTLLSATAFSTAVIAEESSEAAKSESQPMPMMGAGQGGMPMMNMMRRRHEMMQGGDRPMMSPPCQDMPMMRGGMQRGPGMMGHGGRIPMIQHGPQGDMPMMEMMRKRHAMMMGEQGEAGDAPQMRGRMPMMRHGEGGTSMQDMMRKRHEAMTGDKTGESGPMGMGGKGPMMMQSRMQDIEKRMSNIEDLLQQLVDQQKP